jgi:cytochrome c oxidase cbb3-type subunit 3
VVRVRVVGPVRAVVRVPAVGPVQVAAPATAAGRALAAARRRAPAVATVRAEGARTRSQAAALKTPAEYAPARSMPRRLVSLFVRSFVRLFFALVIFAAPGCKKMTEQQKHGAELYARMCVVCHGQNGEGYKADEAPAVAHPEFLASVSDDFLRRAIAEGRSGSTMSAWAKERGGPLSREDVDAVVAFLRVWDKKGGKTPLDEHPLPTGAAGTAGAARGEALFAVECASCHGPNGTSGPNVRIGDRDLLATASNGFLRHAIRHGRNNTKMPAFRAKLGDPAIDDILLHLRARAATPQQTTFASPPKQGPLPLGPVPLNPKGREPKGFKTSPETTSADVIKAELDHGARLSLLDARAPSDYMNEHIAGAVSVPFYDPDQYFSKLPKDSWLVCYCACPHAESGQLAGKLRSAGFTKVTVLDEGLGYWRSKNYGTSKGAEP